MPKNINTIDIVIKDYVSEVTAEVNRAIDLWLEESAGELESDIARISRAPGGQTAGSYKHVVDKNKKEAQVGSPEENAIWEEYGTGEYALYGNGRKGYWVYVKGFPRTKKKDRKYYTKEMARRLMYALRAKGLDAWYTNGKKPWRPIYKAFTAGQRRVEDGLRKRLARLKGGDSK